MLRNPVDRHALFRPGLLCLQSLIWCFSVFRLLGIEPTIAMPIYIRYSSGTTFEPKNTLCSLQKWGCQPTGQGWSPWDAYLCGEGAGPGIMVYHLILGKKATVQHISPSGPDEVRGLVPNHAGLEEREGEGDMEASGDSYSLPCLTERRRGVKLSSGLPQL